jgi:hypothetical protein
MLTPACPVTCSHIGFVGAQVVRVLLRGGVPLHPRLLAKPCDALLQGDS